jgi:hypothetical protein
LAGAEPLHRPEPPGRNFPVNLLRDGHRAEVVEIACEFVESALQIPLLRVSFRGESMNDTKLRLSALAIACCLVLVLAPMLASAQIPGSGIVQGAKHGVQKGAEEVQKGVETGAEKTKEGAEAVGQGTKKAITGEDTNNENRMKPGESQRNTTTSETEGSQTGQKHMPKTAGELPLLALAGALALSVAGVSQAIRRKRTSRVF